MTAGRQVCIVGVGETDYSRDSKRSANTLALQASMAAVRDAGLQPGDIDGIVPSYNGPRTEDIIANLGIRDLKFSATVFLGGAASVGALQLAKMALECGYANYVLAFRARNGYSDGRTGSNTGYMQSVLPGIEFRRSFEAPYGFVAPAQWYALLCRRHMDELGTTRAHLGAVAVTMNRHAQLNPRAQMYGRPLTMEKYLGGRIISDPYTVYDCCLETDGACAVLLTTLDRARNLRKPPIILAGVGEGHPDSPDDLVGRQDFMQVGLHKAAPRAFAMAGIQPRDLDAAMIYDCFTFEVIHQLEALGVCGEGEGGPFVAAGHIGLGGKLPVNTHGGAMAEGHILGMNHVLEAVRQLRGECGERQVPNAKHIAITGWGDLGDGTVALLRRD